MLIELSSHDFAVIIGGLGALCKKYPIPSENNNVQGTIDNIQAQVDEIFKWQDIWQNMNPILRDEINIKVGVGLSYVESTISCLDIDEEFRKHLKKTVMRCEFK